MIKWWFVECTITHSRIFLAGLSGHGTVAATFRRIPLFLSYELNGLR